MLSDADVALIAVAAVAGSWCAGSHAPVAAVLVVLAVMRLAVTRRRLHAVAAMVLLGALAAGVGDRAWEGLRPDVLGPHRGVVELVADPAPRQGALQIVVRVGEERYEGWLRGRLARRVAALRAGERIWIAADLQPLGAERARQVASRHVVGRLDVHLVGDVLPANPLDRAANRVHELIERGAVSFGAADGALFRGLVLGDDRDQPRAMTDAFRAAGMSHLTAVSGQNIALLLAAASPLLHRIGGGPRLAVTLLLIGWFVVVTRAEPSVVRAGLMAAISAFAVARGAQASAVRALAWTVTILVLVDPLIVVSIGFWLSVGATAGLILIAPRLAPALPGPRWLADAVAITIAAQAGVAPVSWAVFGTPPIASLLANVLAVPVAGAVMLYGTPAGLLAGASPPAIGAVVQIPSRIGVRWVAVVAQLAARLEPPAPWPAVLWLVVAIGVVVVLARNRATPR